MTALLVVAVIVAFVGVDVVVQARRRRRPSPGAVSSPLSALEPPTDRFLHRGHTWVQLLPTGAVRVGIDAFLAGALDRVTRVRLPAPGAALDQGQRLATLMLGDRELGVLTPVSGETVQRNALLEDNPEVLVLDPYNLGWIAELTVPDHEQAVRGLHVGSGARAFLQREVQRLADFLGARAGSELSEDNLPLRGAVSRLSAIDERAFEEQFLRREDRPE